MSDEQKSILIKFLVFFGVVAVIALAVNLGFFLSRKNQHQEAKYGIVRVYFRNSDWSIEENTVFHRSLGELSRLGPTFTETFDRNAADILVEKRSLDCSTLAGQFVVGTRNVQIDPRCVLSSSSLQTVFVHEIGHSLGMQHVCRSTERGRKDCSPVGFGVAVMNPAVYYLEIGGNYNREIPAQEFSTYQLQPLDFAEFNRVWPNFRRDSQ